MPFQRSVVFKGVNDQRDRSRRKKHHKRCDDAAAKALNTCESEWESRLQALQEWLAWSFRQGDELKISNLQSFSLTRFLKSIPQIDIDVDEKLRQLAIFLEPDCQRMEQPAGWRILRRIYQEAIKYDSKWPHHYHSMSLSLQGCADTAPVEIAEKLLRESVAICDEGLAICPGTASLYSARGLSLYNLYQKEAAIVDFEVCLDRDPKDMWAALYRAHSFHDLKRWDQAIAAYESIDLSFFDGIQSWRAVLLRDQLAICRMHAGDYGRALEELNAALHRYEQNPELLFVAQYLREAADSVLGEKIADRVAALLKKEGWEWP